MNCEVPNFLGIRLVSIFFILIFGQVLYAWPPSLRQSFQLELLYNSAITEDDLRRMAHGLLIAKGEPDDMTTYNKANKLPLNQIRKLVTEEINITCFEIPLNEFAKHFAFASKVLNNKENRQIFERNGVTYVRWIVHPFNHTSGQKKFAEKFQKYLVNNKYKAIISSSRSLAILDQDSQEVVGLKVSLPDAFGPFKSKKYLSTHAAFHFNMSEIIAADEILRQNFFLENSFVAAQAEGFDEGQLERDLSLFRQDGIILSLAALLNPELARSFSRKNGYGENWEAFINATVMPSLGKIAGYLYENYGLVHNSLHSQNITVHFGKYGKFKEVYLRDLDFNVDFEKFKNRMGIETANSFIAKANVRDFKTLDVDFAPLIVLGMADEQLLTLKFGQNFTMAFLQEIARLRGMTLDESILRERVKASINLNQEINRSALDLTAELVEKILDFSNEVNLATRNSERLVPNNQIREPTDMEASKKFFIESLDSPHLIVQMDSLSLLEVLRSLVNNFIKDPFESQVGKILTSGNLRQIREFVVQLKKTDNNTAEKFFSILIDRYPQILAKLDLAFFFLSCRNENLIKKFIDKASPESIKQIWSSRNSNGLLMYPRTVLDRFFRRCDDSLLSRISSEISDIPDYEKQNMINNSIEFIKRFKDQKMNLIKCENIL